jgi:hypothetical protein
MNTSHVSPRTDNPRGTDIRGVQFRTEIRGIQFPADEDRDDPRNVGLLADQPYDAAASPRYFIEFSRRESFRLACFLSSVHSFITNH